MSTDNVKWLVLENIFWGAVALALLWYADGWWKALAIVPIGFVNQWRNRDDKG